MDSMMDEIDETIAKQNPEIVAGFIAGRMVGRFDIIFKLAAIINQEVKDTKQFVEMLGRKNNE
ncbi:MAG: hypothetical protein J6W04_00770 [Bacteroidales bacterium]|nr:hypothetical protein [Bacteroidales bacterium]